MTTTSVSLQIHLLVLERIDPDRNMQRFYVLSVTPTLFGDTALVREWGRLGRAGQTRSDVHETMDGAKEALSVWLRRKQKRGYRPVFEML